MKTSIPAPTSVFKTSAPGARIRTLIYGAVIACYLIMKVAGVPSLAPLLSGLALAAILLSLPAATMFARIISSVFICSGTWMLWKAGFGPIEYLGAYGDMAYLLALFAAIPVLAEPIKLGGYGMAIQSVLQRRVKGIFALNTVTTLLSYLCASFISLAAIPIMMASMQPVVDKYPLKDKQRFMTSAAISGYVLPLYWTPMSGVVGVVLHTLRLDWILVFPSLFFLSIVCLPVNWAIFYFLEARHTPRSKIEPAEAAEPGVATSVMPLVEMALGIAALVISIVLIEHWSGIGLITVVTMVAIPAAFIWCAILGQGRRFVVEGGREFLVRMPRMADQFTVFLSAGFFATAIRMSGTGDFINVMFMHLKDTIGTQLLLLSMPLMALCASFLGIHPMVVIALLGESLKPEVLGISPIQLAVTLVGSSVMTFMLGPFSGTLGFVQSFSQVPALRLARWNAPYAAGYFIVLSLVILY